MDYCLPETEPKFDLVSLRVWTSILFFAAVGLAV